jgi:hypothetical protein
MEAGCVIVETLSIIPNYVLYKRASGTSTPTSHFDLFSYSEFPQLSDGADTLQTGMAAHTLLSSLLIGSLEAELVFGRRPVFYLFHHLVQTLQDSSLPSFSLGRPFIHLAPSLRGDVTSRTAETSISKSFHRRYVILS